MREDKSEQSLPSHIMCAIRDYGKGWGNPVWSEYMEEARNLVKRVKHIIEKLWTEGQSVEKTAKLPVLVALELMTALATEDLNTPPPKGKVVMMMRVVMMRARQGQRWWR